MSTLRHLSNRTVFLLFVFLGLALAGFAYHFNNQRFGRVSHQRFRHSTSGISAAVPTVSPNARPGFLSRLFNLKPSKSVSESSTIQLQGVIISKSRPVVMINSTALGKGETASVRLASRHLRVECVDITTDGALIKPDDAELVTLQLQPTSPGKLN